MDRSATETIKGYFYQFDYAILTLLNLSNADDTIQLECIEDIDINTDNETIAVQCKYYSKTEYNHSVIKEAIMYMLSHFAEVKAGKKKEIKYFLTGHYKSGQEKLPSVIDIEFLKKNFLTYTKTKTVGDKKVKNTFYHHEQLELDDNDLSKFIKQLTISVNSQEFDVQFQSILTNLKLQFNCSDFTAEYFFYNNALGIIKELSIQNHESNRLIKKSEFLTQIDKKAILFNEWFVQIKGSKAHWAALRKEYFTSLNISPFERFFFINTEGQTIDPTEITDIIHTISKKWSKLSQRETSPFCPYIYLNGISERELIKIKTQLLNEGISINDGYPFLGSDFSVEHITRPANYQNGIKLKFLSSLSDLVTTLSNIKKRREVYQFYFDNIILPSLSPEIIYEKIQIKKLSDIKQIV